MNVLIIELGGSHIECAYSFVYFLKSENHKAHLVCNKKLTPLFPDTKELSGILEVENKFNFLTQISTFYRIRNYINQNNIDTVIVNTVEIKLIRNLFLFIPKNINCVGLVHNAQKLEEGTTLKYFLSTKMKKYFVLGDFLLNNLKPYKKIRVQSFFPVYFPPSKNNKIFKPAGEYWITIPGEANQNRRDYLELINEIKKTNFNKFVKFIFLGANKLGNDIPFDYFKQEWWEKHIVTFSSQLEYDVFHNYIQLSDIILPLIKMKEDTMYQKNRISGSYNLGLSYKKLFLMPFTTKDNTDLQPFSIYYDSMQSLIKIINDLIENPSIKSKLEEAYLSSQFNDIKKMAKNMCDFIFKK